MSLITEEECLRRINAARDADREHIDELHDALKKAEFRASVAEWAVAGVLSRGLQLHFTMNDQRQEGFDMAMHVGTRCGAEFLRRAELEFKDHAEFSRLKMSVDTLRYLHISSDGVPDKPWPVPFRSKP